MKKSLTSIISLLLSLMILVSAFPITVNAATVGNIVGTFLVENTEDPVVNLEVTLQDSSRNVLATTTTDENGNFKFTGHPVGEYYVVPTGAAYHAYDTEFQEENGYYAIVVSDGDNTFFKGGNTRYLRETLGSGKLIKIEKDTNKPIPGTVFGFYNSKDELLGTYTTDSNGEIVVGDLSLGNYYFLEKTPAEGYFTSLEKAYVEVKDSSEATVTVTNDPICSITLIKTDRDTGEPLYGAFFELRDSTNNILGTYETDKNGTLVINGLTAGNYKLVEFIPPVGHYIGENSTHEITLSSATPNKTVYTTNAPLPMVSIVKVSSLTGQIIDGAVVDIMQGNKVIWDDMVLTDEMVLTLEPGEYSAVEVKAPAGYVLDSTPVNFTVVDDATVENKVVLKNDPVIVEINKFGEDENGTFDYNGKKYSFLPGCEFVMTNKADSTISYTWTTGDSTQEFVAVPVGEYEIKEIKTPELYQGISEPISFTVEETNKVNFCNIYNDIKIFSVVIDKVNPQGKYIFTDFELLKGNAVVDTFNAGSYRIDLQPGEYTIKELAAPKGYAKAPAFTFTIDTNGVITESADFVEIDDNVITITNKPITLNVSKVDAETMVILKGAELKLSKNDGTYEKVFTTNGEVVTLSDELTPGEYTLEETVAPDGYAKAEPLVFTIEDTSETQSVVLKNYRVLGTITINKTGEKIEYVGLVEKITGLFVNVFEIVTGQTPLGGVAFNLYAEEDIVHPDGVSPNLYNKGDIVATGVTNASGLLTFKNLPFGLYKIVETNAPDGYYTTSNSTTVLVASKDAVNVDIENYYKTFTVKVTKVDSEDSHKVLKGAIFGLYANEDIKSLDGSVIVAKGSLVAVSESNNDGLAIMTVNLPIGKYILKEIKAPEGYILSENDKIIDLDFDGLNVSEYTHEAVFTNDPTVVTIEKLDAVSSTPISGAKLQLLNEDGSIYAEWTTGVDAKIFKAIPVGKYTLHEVESPTGYKVAEDMIVEVEETSTVQSFKMYDGRITGSITINKFVKGTSTPLPGVTYELYNETYNLFIGTFTTNSSGQIYIPNLPVATYSNGVATGEIKYKLTEISTQPGYVRNTSPYTFILSPTDTDSTLNIENDYTKLHVYKKDMGTGENLPGAELAIYASGDFDPATGMPIQNAVPYAEWISGSDAYVLEKVPVGDYLLVEKSAPEGYVKAKNTIFAVDEIETVQNLILENDYIKVEVSKFDKDGTTYLPGAELALYERSEFNNDLTLKDNATPYLTWTTDLMSYPVYRIPAGEYLLVEIASPLGYIKVNPKLITVLETTEVQSVSITNDFTKVQISKKDITTSNELPGADLMIYDYETWNRISEDESVNVAPLYSWTSSATPYYIEKLPVGKYVLVETSAPAGYVKSEAVEFEILETGDVQSVTMYNDITTVSFFKIDAETEEFLPGAEFEIYTVDSNNNPVTKVYEWTSTDEEFTITKMPVGKYVLYETKAPNGYVAAEPLYFEIIETNKEQFFIIKNTKTTVTLSKMDNASNILTGAEYAIYDESQFDAELNLIENAEPIANWVSAESAETFRGVASGKYLFVETKAPAGYVTGDPVLVEVKDINENQVFTFINKPTHVGIYKVDAKTGDTVAGAELELYNAADYVDGEFIGEPIDKWTTTLELKEFNALPVGEYIVREISVPAGYTMAEPLEITVKETSELQIFNLANNKTIVSISKLDKDTKEFLAGAEFVIYFDINNNNKVDEEDVEVGKWVSEDKAYVVEGLPIGQYILVESKAPEGYKTIENTILNVRDTSELQIFEIFNEKNPIVEPELPNTGDRAIYIISGIFLTAGLILVLTVLAKKDKIKIK